MGQGTIGGFRGSKSGCVPRPVAHGKPRDFATPGSCCVPGETVATMYGFALQYANEVGRPMYTGLWRCIVRWIPDVKTVK
eukprot:jgi/Botrbrau1/19044/Bobra.0100s0070.1